MAECTYQPRYQMSTQSTPRLSHPVWFPVDSKNFACSITYEELVMLLIHIWDHLLIVIMLPFQESANLNSQIKMNKFKEDILGWPHLKLWRISTLPHPEVLVSVVSFSITPYCPQNLALMRSHISFLQTKHANILILPKNKKEIFIKMITNESN